MPERSAELMFTDPEGRVHASLLIVHRKGKLKTLSLKEKINTLEAPVQISEGGSYDYSLTPNRSGYRLRSIPGIIFPSLLPNYRNTGRVEPGLNTGTLQLSIEDSHGRWIASTSVEVCSTKLSYREEYRSMMEFISSYSCDLLLRANAPSMVNVQSDLQEPATTSEHKVAFLCALFDSARFRAAMHQLHKHPHSRIHLDIGETDVRRGMAISSLSLRQFSRSTQRLPLPSTHPLARRMTAGGIERPSVPSRMIKTVPVDKTDTPENQFVKYTLRMYRDYLDHLRERLSHLQTSPNANLLKDVDRFIVYLDSSLDSGLLKEVGELKIIPLGSPVLQKKAGYRDFLRFWLEFNVAARLNWEAAEGVYTAGNRDVATLYEYWTFFQLLAILESKFALQVNPLKDLFDVDRHGFHLRLRKGSELTLSGRFQRLARWMRFRFSYNRTFRSNTQFHTEGSFSSAMRPDFTLSVWPDGFDALTAEALELMVHVHFDAKYRVESLNSLFGVDEDIDGEGGLQASGIYKRADLLKMHAYRDAIRRTEGAYVLYPGTANKNWRGYHEVLPGIGAFGLRPSVEGGDSGSAQLTTFLEEVVAHLCNRASKRERVAWYRWDSQKGKTDPVHNYLLPEVEGPGRSRHPRDQDVIVLELKPDAVEWQLAHHLFICPVVLGHPINPKLLGATYVALGERGSTASLLKLAGRARLVSTSACELVGYPFMFSQFSVVMVDDIQEDSKCLVTIPSSEDAPQMTMDLYSLLLLRDRIL